MLQSIPNFSKHELIVFALFHFVWANIIWTAIMHQNILKPSSWFNIFRSKRLFKLFYFCYGWSCIFQQYQTDTINSINNLDWIKIVWMKIIEIRISASASSIPSKSQLVIHNKANELRGIDVMVVYTDFYGICIVYRMI